MNKRLFLKMSLASLPVLALFSQPVLAEENIHFSSCRKLGRMDMQIFTRENLVILPSKTVIMMVWRVN